MNLRTISDDALHLKIYTLAQRRRTGDTSCDNLLGRLVDEADRRGRQYDTNDGPADGDEWPATDRGYADPDGRDADHGDA